MKVSCLAYYAQSQMESATELGWNPDLQPKQLLAWDYKLLAQNSSAVW